LDDEARLLIQRAFWDCADINLVKTTEGHSGATVYHAHAELTAGVHGPWPQPYFVKIGKRAKILTEYTKYEQHVDPYIPFHLGPQLEPERCCLGATQGIIVGDFVEESEDLLDCACEGRAAAAIACLFDRTLQGWHRAARKDGTSIAERFTQWFPKAIGNDRFECARTLGAQRSLADLQTLFQRCDSKPVFVGPIHGDLHAANVRVRATDAIVIDFFRHGCNLPLLYDAACLEASLLVDGFRQDNRDITEWMSSLRVLYDESLLDGTLPHVSPKNQSCWFHTCVRQIRRYARQWECRNLQYAGALGLALLQKAVKDKDALDLEGSRRAAAYVLAEQVLSIAFGFVADSHRTVTQPQ